MLSVKQLTKTKRVFTVPVAILATLLFIIVFHWITQKSSRSLPLQYPDTEFKNATELSYFGQRFAAAKPPQTLLVILLWTKLFGRDDWALGSPLGQTPFEKLKCPVSNCYVTNDRAFLKSASAVLVNFRDDFNFTDLPEIRPSNQYWIYFLWESPDHTYHWTWQENLLSPDYLNEQFKGFFNWTMTYRLDSDIPFLYGRFFKKSNSDRKAVLTDRLANKTKSVIWIQSNCDTRSHRSEFVQELQRYIDVEVVGNCGSGGLISDLTYGVCSRPNIFQPMTQECLNHISSTYKYYLATENSLCRDYVTEKFFRGASLDLIPVVFNGATMSLFGPPHSYIDAKDYYSPRKLAQFLIELGKDKEKYNSRFWWKEFYKAENFWDNDAFTRSFCDLCAKLTLANLEPEKHAKVYTDMKDWWTTQGNCYEGETQF